MAKGFEFAVLVFLFVYPLSFVFFNCAKNFYFASLHNYLIVCLLFKFYLIFSRFNCCSCFLVFTTKIFCVNKLLNCSKNVGWVSNAFFLTI